MRDATGFGVGLRTAHYEALLERASGPRPVGLDWLEAITENHFTPGGTPRAILSKLRRDFPVVLHGVSLSIGSVDAISEDYLGRLEGLVSAIEPAFVSDHLCWGGFGGHYAHDLLPLPFTVETLQHVAERVSRVQERLRRPIALENVSSYLQFTHAAMHEWEFLSELTRRTGCAILLDVNNVFVSAQNHGFDAETYVRGLPSSAIVQMHLAGHGRCDKLCLDTHDAPVADEVWALYAVALRTHGRKPTSIEWDEQVPPLDTLLAESTRAAHIAQEALRDA